MRIGIVGYNDEPHVEHVKKLLQNKQVEPVIIDTKLFPQEVKMSYEEGKTQYQSNDISDIKTYYVRTIYISLPVFDMPNGTYKLVEDWKTDYLSTREKHSFLASWLRSQRLKGKNIINPTESFDLHFLKLFQLELLRKNGIKVPQTLVSNSANEIIKFKEDMGEVVYKPVGGGSECAIFKAEDLSEERLNALRNAPVIFQEYIPGDNIRVYVIDNRIISSGIIPTENVDYRVNEGMSVQKVNLPSYVKNMCVKAVRLCGMRFSGIDIKRIKNNEYVLIECNPSPMFVGFSQKIGIDFGDALTDFLIKLTR